MSVLVPELGVFNVVFNKILSYSGHKECDINYCGVFTDWGRKQAQEFVESLLRVNEATYNATYHKNEEEPKSLVPFMKWSTKFSTIDSVQMLKFLQCIRYNSDLEEINTNMDINKPLYDDYKRTLNTLDKAIARISQSIIEAKTNYDKCRYSDTEGLKLTTFKRG